jgi:hypothetical protein
MRFKGNTEQPQCDSDFNTNHIFGKLIVSKGNGFGPHSEDLSGLGHTFEHIYLHECHAGRSTPPSRAVRERSNAATTKHANTAIAEASG